MISLALDASTYSGSVAVFEDGRVLAHDTVPMRERDAERLMPAVAGALERAGIAPNRIHRVICGGGPGSFTSLRIAASIAKGLAAGCGIPLYRVPSLGLIVAAASLSDTQAEARFVAAMDALRGESYVQSFARVGRSLRETDQPHRVATDRLERYAAGLGARLVSHTAGNAPDARGAALFFDALDTEGPVNLGAWEPLYGRPAEAQAKWDAQHGRTIEA